MGGGQQQQQQQQQHGAGLDVPLASWPPGLVSSLLSGQAMPLAVMQQQC